MSGPSPSSRKLKAPSTMVFPIEATFTESWQEILRELSSPTSNPIPRQLGQYEIQREISRGGMGIVYEGYDAKLRRRVAIKVPISEGVDSLEAMTRFQQEAEAMAALQHPNIVAVYEVGAESDTPYVAMELLSGPNLHERILHRPLPPQEAASILVKLAEAVAHAHQRAMVHRDLKPANILFSSTNVPKIIDFGTVRIATRTDTAPRNSLTQVGILIGTPQYMAPEQTNGDPASCGPAGDIYSLGVILYEMLTGAPPFNGARPLDIIHDVRHKDPVSPRLIQSQIPRDLETICLKCLEKRPERRYESALALREDLQRYLNNEPIHAKPLSTSRRLLRTLRKRPTTVGLVVGLVFAGLIGLGAFAWQFHHTLLALAAAVEQRQIAENQQQLAEQQKQIADEQTLVAQESQRKTDEIRDQLAEQLGSTKWNLYRAQIRQAQHLFDQSNIIGAKRVLDSMPQDHRHEWEWNYFARSIEGHSWKVYMPEVVAPKSRSVKWVKLCEPSPSGKLLAILTTDPYLKQNTNNLDPDHDLANLVILESQTGRVVTQISPCLERPGQSLRWRSEHQLILSDSRANVFAFELPTRKLLHEWSADFASYRPASISFQADNIVNRMAFSPRGQLAVRYAGPNRLEVFDPLDQASLRAITIPYRRVAVREFSANERFVSLEILTEEHQPSGHVVFDLQQNHVVYESKNSGFYSGFSPNSEYLVTISNATGARAEVLVLSTRTWQVLHRHEIMTREVSPVIFSPENLHCAFRFLDRHSLQILHLSSGELSERFTVGSRLTDWQFSPDGRYIATAASDGMVRLAECDQAQSVVTLPGHLRSVSQLRFHPDGHSIYSGGIDEFVIGWDLMKLRSSGGIMRLPRVGGEGSQMGAMTFTPQNTLRVADTRRGLVEFDRDTGLLVQEKPLQKLLPRHAKELTDYEFSANGQTLVGPLPQPEAKFVQLGLWDGTTGELFRELPANLSRHLCSALSPDAKYAVSSGLRRNGKNAFVYQLWNTQTGEMIVERSSLLPVIAATFDQDNRVALAFAQNVQLRTQLPLQILNETGEILEQIDIPHRGPYVRYVNALRFAPSGRELVLASSNTSELLILDLQTNTLTKSIPITVTPTQLTFSPDARRLALTGYSAEVQLFDTVYWEEIIIKATPKDRDNDYAYPAKVIFSHDGRTLAVNRWNTELMIWQIPLASASPLAADSQKIYGYHLESAQDAFRDGRRFAAAFHLNQLRKLEAPTPEAKAHWLRLVHEVHSRRLMPALMGGVTAFED